MLQLYAYKMVPIESDEGLSNDEIVLVKPLMKKKEEMEKWLSGFTGLKYKIVIENNLYWYGNSSVFTTLQEVVREVVEMGSDENKFLASFFYEYPHYEFLMDKKSVKNIALILPQLYDSVKDKLWLDILEGKITSMSENNNYIIWKETLNIYEELCVLFSGAADRKFEVHLLW